MRNLLQCTILIKFDLTYGTLVKFDSCLGVRSLLLIFYGTYQGKIFNYVVDLIVSILNNMPKVPCIFLIFCQFGTIFLATYNIQKSQDHYTLFEVEYVYKRSNIYHYKKTVFKLKLLLSFFLPSNST